MGRWTLMTLALSTLAGCVSVATRETPGAFRVLATAQVAPTRVPQFIDCLSDGLLHARPHLPSHIAQARRADGWRVEVYFNDLTITSTDVTDAGVATMWLAMRARLLDSSGDVTALQRCAAAN